MLISVFYTRTCCISSIPDARFSVAIDWLSSRGCAPKSPVVREVARGVRWWCRIRKNHSSDDRQGDHDVSANGQEKHRVRIAVNHLVGDPGHQCSIELGAIALWLAPMTMYTSPPSEAKIATASAADAFSNAPPADTERKLWYYLLMRRLDGHQFPRYNVIEPEIVDANPHFGQNLSLRKCGSLRKPGFNGPASRRPCA